MNPICKTGTGELQEPTSNGMMLKRIATNSFKKQGREKEVSNHVFLLRQGR